MEEPDGRRRKGQRRRQLLLDAVMRLVERGGTAAVTQRRVAAEAGVPPSAVTYYYATVQDMLVDALVRVNDDYVEAVRSLPGDPAAALRDFSALLTASSPGDRIRLTAEWELFLMAARHPELRAEADRWSRAVDAFLSRYLPDPVDRAAAAAAVDGLFLRACTEDPPPGADQVHRVLRRLVPLPPHSAPAEPR